MDTKKLLSFLEDKIDDADLDKVQNMLNDDDDNASMAGDSRRKMTVDTMPFGTTASVLKDIAKIDAAKAAVQPHVPHMAMDGLVSEDSVYRRALSTLGRDTKELPVGAAKAIWPVAARAGGKTKPMSAGDTAQLRERFPHAFRLKAR